MIPFIEEHPKGLMSLIVAGAVSLGGLTLDHVNTVRNTETIAEDNKEEISELKEDIKIIRGDVKEILKLTAIIASKGR